MLRAGISSLGVIPRCSASSLRLSASGTRAFSSGSFFRSNIIKSLPKRPTWTNGSARTFMTEKATILRPSQAESWKRFGLTAAGVALAVFASDAFLNRETRDALSMAERSYLHETFQYTGGGLVLTALAARSMFKSGVAFRIMAANPWVVLGVSLVGSIGSMMGVMYTSPEKTFQKHAFWLAFNACQAATLSPLFFLNPAILSRAALYTCGVVGSLSYVGATARYALLACVERLRF
ncbi:hypothetical protein HGRIS_008376 [Hohenbuehelia grisea]|uniref:Uncharacterized protein n=1 Tax=Hohenbuehelia grisea TaxID=104357 RepID=A0ABR3J982_9AGAR